MTTVKDGDPKELSCDAVFDGNLSIWQHQKGYRFGLDSLLLGTDLPDIPDDGRVVDLGAGQGAVALTIAYHNPKMTVVAVERQPSLVELLRRNVEHNELENVKILSGDLRQYRDLLPAHSADLVVANPPYYRKGSRRPSPQRQRAEARHELFGGLRDFIAAAAYVLDQRGWLQIITPPMRLAEALQATTGTDLSAASLRFYHSRRQEKAYLVEYRWRRGGAPDFSIRPPLFIYREEGIYSTEVAERIGQERR